MKHTGSSAQGGRIPPVPRGYTCQHARPADPESKDTNGDYPDGGREAWTTILGCWCGLLAPMGWLNALAVLQARVSQHELAGLPESTTGWIFSTYAFLMFSCGVQVGPCFEPPIQTRQLQPGGGALTAGRVGPIFDAYNVKLLIVPGSMGMVVMAMILSICKGSSRPPFPFLPRITAILTRP